jgi:hypothetical protein
MTTDLIRPEVRAAVIARDGMICQLCGREVVAGSALYRSGWRRSPDGRYLLSPPDGHFKRMLTLDHIIPRSKGGTHDADNLRVACSSCNSRRGPTYVRSERISLKEARLYVAVEVDEHELVIPLAVEREGALVGVAILEVDGQVGTLHVNVGDDPDPDADPRLLSAARQLLPLLGYRGVTITTQFQGDAR